MHIRKDDTVVVITGKDKGKKGKVIKPMPKENKVVVEGVNVQTKHAKQTRTAPAEIKHQEGPIDVSNVMFYDSKAKAPTIQSLQEDWRKARLRYQTGKEVKNFGSKT